MKIWIDPSNDPNGAYDYELMEKLPHGPSFPMWRIRVNGVGYRVGHNLDVVKRFCADPAFRREEIDRSVMHHDR
jgi:hypothetical protein